MTVTSEIIGRDKIPPRRKGSGIYYESYQKALALQPGQALKLTLDSPRAVHSFMSGFYGWQRQGKYKELLASSRGNLVFLYRKEEA